jgi:Uma2 family endonuclease
MSSKAGITAAEYLHTSYPDLDREYRDGELVERSLPDSLHGKTQFLIAAFFATIWKRLSPHVRIETRMKLAEGLYLIPDVAVFHPAEPAAKVPEQPPLIAIEILSEDDRMNAVRTKLQEYRNWGVQHVWLVDPYSSKLYCCNEGLHEVASLQVAALGIEMTPADLFE